MVELQVVETDAVQVACIGTNPLTVRAISTTPAESIGENAFGPPGARIGSLQGPTGRRESESAEGAFDSRAWLFDSRADRRTAV